MTCQVSKRRLRTPTDIRSTERSRRHSGIPIRLRISTATFFNTCKAQVSSFLQLFIPLALHHTEDMTAENTISVIGLGLMGSALARVFLQNGWKTTVWNRSSHRVYPLLVDGAVASASAAECVNASRVVVICLLDPQAVHDVLVTVDRQACADRILVDYTSGTRSQTRQSQEMAMSLSFSAYIRGAILVTPKRIGQPDSAIYYAGDEAAFRSIENDFNILGRQSYVGSNLDAASLHGCMLMDVMFGLAAGFLQSVAVLKRSGLYTSGGAKRFLSGTLTPLLAQSYPKLLSDLARQIDNEDYLSEDGDGAPVGLLAKTIQSMTQTHTELSLSSIILDPILELMKTRIAQGGADEELSSLVETIGDPAALSKLQQ